MCCIIVDSIDTLSASSKHLLKDRLAVELFRRIITHKSIKKYKHWVPTASADTSSTKNNRHHFSGIRISVLFRHWRADLVVHWSFSRSLWFIWGFWRIRKFRTYQTDQRQVCTIRTWVWSVRFKHRKFRVLLNFGHKQMLSKFAKIDICVMQPVYMLCCKRTRSTRQRRKSGTESRVVCKLRLVLQALQIRTTFASLMPFDTFVQHLQRNCSHAIE